MAGEGGAEILRPRKLPGPRSGGGGVHGTSVWLEHRNAARQAGETYWGHTVRAFVTGTTCSVLPGGPEEGT